MQAERHEGHGATK